MGKDWRDTVFSGCYWCPWQLRGSHQWQPGPRAGQTPSGSHLAGESQRSRRGKQEKNSGVWKKHKEKEFTHPRPVSFWSSWSGIPVQCVASSTRSTLEFQSYSLMGVEAGETLLCGSGMLSVPQAPCPFGGQACSAMLVLVRPAWHQLPWGSWFPAPRRGSPGPQHHPWAASVKPLVQTEPVLYLLITSPPVGVCTRDVLELSPAFGSWICRWQLSCFTEAVQTIAAWLFPYTFGEQKAVRYRSTQKQTLVLRGFPQRSRLSHRKFGREQSG